MRSVGATEGQIRKMLGYECRTLIWRSVGWAFLIATPMVYLVRTFLVSSFGYIKISFPWAVYGAAAGTAAILIVLMTQSCFMRMDKGGVVESIRDERG